MWWNALWRGVVWCGVVELDVLLCGRIRWGVVWWDVMWCTVVWWNLMCSWRYGTREVNCGGGDVGLVRREVMEATCDLWGWVWGRHRWRGRRDDSFEIVGVDHVGEMWESQRETCGDMWPECDGDVVVPQASGGCTPRGFACSRRRFLNPARSRPTLTICIEQIMSYKYTYIIYQV